MATTTTTTKDQHSIAPTPRKEREIYDKVASIYEASAILWSLGAVPKAKVSRTHNKIEVNLLTLPARSRFIMHILYRAWYVSISSREFMIPLSVNHRGMCDI